MMASVMLEDDGQLVGLRGSKRRLTNLGNTSTKVSKNGLVTIFGVVREKLFVFQKNPSGADSKMSGLRCGS